MKQNNYFEIIVGTFVLFCAGFFFFNSFKSAKIKTGFNYHLLAKFDNVSGIKAGSDVVIAGIKVGTVEENSLDVKNYRAILRFGITSDIKLPTDSSAKIGSAGLLGEKFLEITPGGDDEFLSSGQEILYTQSSVNFEQLLGKFIFSSKKENKNDEK